VVVVVLEYLNRINYVKDKKNDLNASLLLLIIDSTEGGF
jgi:hypothetical protein